MFDGSISAKLDDADVASNTSNPSNANLFAMLAAFPPILTRAEIPLVLMTSSLNKVPFDVNRLQT